MSSDKKEFVNLRDWCKKEGIKLSWLCKQLGMKPSNFNFYLNNQISDDLNQKIRDVLKKQALKYLSIELRFVGNSEEK